MTERAVLVVDESPGSVESVRRALGESDCRVLAVGDPTEALDLVLGERVAVIIGALDFAGGRGVHLLAEARRLFPLVPRIAVSGGRDFDRLVAAVNRAEIMRFLRKPLDLVELRQAVEDALGRTRSLHEGLGTETIAQRRRIALIDLESKCPGISFVARGSDGYFIPRARLRSLAERYRGTPFAALVGDLSDSQPLAETP